MARGSQISRCAACFVVVVTAIFPLATAAISETPDLSKVEFFEKKIRPILVESCYTCHSASARNLKGELFLDSRGGLLAGGEVGPSVVPGKPEDSLLIRAIAYGDPDLQMPPKSRLPDAVVEDFRRWIRDGAHWAASAPKPATVARSGFDLKERRATHWAWAPVKPAAVPSVDEPRWARSEVDRFLQARRQKEGVQAGPRADRETRLRRLSFALTGLPPQPGAWAEFLRSDDTPENWQRAVDRVLASPHFGERWARHWLDKVRYAETMGHEFDYPILGAWRYRDYVVRAFNEDLPYDRFTREQIAGDVLPGARRRAADGTDEALVATMQYWLCQQVHSPVDVRAQQIETVDNQLDVVSKSFLGLTVSCARCHDHKFDAISARDYYALYGILSSSRYSIAAVDDPAPRREAATELRRLREQLRADAARVVKARNPPEPPKAETRAGRVALRDGDRRMDSRTWFREGDAYSAEVDAEAAGQPVWLEGRGVRLVRAGWQDGGSLSRRYQGAAATATFEIREPFVHVRAAGRGTRLALVVEGFTLIQAPIYGDLRKGLKHEQPHWVSFDVGMWKGRRAWIEALDWAAADPASPMPAEFLGAEGWAALGEIIFSGERQAPGLLSPVAPGDWPALVDRWQGDPAGLSSDELDWLEAGLREAAYVPGADWQQAWKAVEARINEPKLAAAMVEGTGWDEPVFIRGNHRSPGPIVKRRFLEAVEVASETLDEGWEGTGRLALAEAVASPENPLFARVMVNWVWAHLFGRGLVASVDNFGVLGEAPTHPELLDWLADGFRRDGWSVKRLIRRMVTSESWQLSSRLTDESAELRDPSNRLLHRASLRRLEGEALRDTLLVLGGNFDPTMGGPPVAVHLTPFMEGRGRPKDSGPLDGLGRRSLYLEVRRNFLSPWMLAFDMPAPATTVGRRTSSNVPAQALAMMNDSLVLAQARRWATRLLEDEGSAEARVERLFAEALFRRPDDVERREAREFLAAGVTAGSDRGELDVWTDLCHAILNSKGFAFVE